MGARLDRIPSLARHLGVLVLVMFSWIIFKFTDMGLLGTAVKGLFGLNHNGFSGAAVSLLFKNNIWFLLLCTAACTPLGRTVRRMLANGARGNTVLWWVNGVWEVVHPAALLILSAMALAGDSYNPFLYFQF